MIKEFIVAYSGGVDSHVLLHMLSICRHDTPHLNIKAVHIDHQLNPHSQQWTVHCQKICDDLHIPLFIETVSVDVQPGDSLEEQARLVRYEKLKKYVEKNSVLLTAHTLNDQAETFLLQALRGSGLKGLSAMPVQKKFGEGILLRPLLSISRHDILNYAKLHDLKWIEDESNVDPRFDRNFLRHEIFPLLAKRKPAVFKNFSRCARLLAEHEKMIVEITQADFEQVKTDDITKISGEKILHLSESRQRLVLRFWLLKNDIRSPSEKQLKHIQRDVLQARKDAHPVFTLNQFSIRRIRSALVLTNHFR